MNNLTPAQAFQPLYQIRDYMEIQAKNIVHSFDLHPHGIGLFKGLFIYSCEERVWSGLTMI
jgi:hypothetical protein